MRDRMSRDIEIWQTDCIEYLAGQPAGYIEAIVTDPPYNDTNRETGGLRVIDKGRADSEPIDIPMLASEFVRVASGSIYVWCGPNQLSEWVREFKEHGLTVRVGVWEKSNPAPTNGQHLWLTGLELCVFARKPKAPFFRHCKAPVWRGPSERVAGFPCPKPVWLMEELITASVPEGGLVLDPFMGSGSTGVAAVRVGRSFLGIEKYEEPYKIARQRIYGELGKGRQEKWSWE